MSAGNKLQGGAAAGDSAGSEVWTPTEDFVPRRFLSNGHLQTIFGNFLPRKYFLPEAEACVIEVSPAEKDLPASHVLCHCHWQPDPSQRLTVLVAHGLEGSSNSQYVLGNAARAWAAGCNVVRMNMRNCGGTEHLSSTLYHSGLSGDVGVVMRTLVAAQGLTAFALAGYSMGGNLVLKLAGELGDTAPGYLKAVVGVSPAIDLAISADALHLAQNRIYERRFIKNLLARFRRKAQLFPAIYSTEGIGTIRTIREFDDRITAHYSGFDGVDDYYFRAAGARVAHRIRVPALILNALDDPFIRILPETRETLRANPNVRLIETPHGGHCAFLASPNGYDGYWAEKTLLNFLLSTMGR